MSALEHDNFDDAPPPPGGVVGGGNRRPSVSVRVPPHDLDAEASLLGAMLLSRDAIAVAADAGIGGSDFYKPAYGHVFDAILALYSRGEPVDAVTVADVLRRNELLDAIGGPALLVTLQAGTPSTTAATRYASIIEELALLRRLIAVAGEISDEAFGSTTDVAATIDRAESLVFEVAQRRVTDSTGSRPSSSGASRSPASPPASPTSTRSSRDCSLRTWSSSVQGPRWGSAAHIRREFSTATQVHIERSKRSSSSAGEASRRRCGRSTSGASSTR
jgi:hypothetical protein